MTRTFFHKLIFEIFIYHLTRIDMKEFLIISLGGMNYEAYKGINYKIYR